MTENKILGLILTCRNSFYGGVIYVNSVKDDYRMVSVSVTLVVVYCGLPIETER